MFLVQLYESLIVFLLKILYKIEFLWQCFLTKARNCCPMFVLTALLNGGLNQSMCLLFFLALLGLGLGGAGFVYESLNYAYWRRVPPGIGVFHG